MDRIRTIKELKKKLEEWKKSEMVKVIGEDKNRRVFKSKEVFDIFGSEDLGILTPFNDYTYEWLHLFFCNLSEWMTVNNPKTKEDLEEFEDSIQEYADSETDIYTSDLTEWLNDSNNNTFYLDEVSKEGITENVLVVAQYRAIEELYNNSFSVILSMFEE